MSRADEPPTGVPRYPEWRTVTLPDGKRAQVTTRRVRGRMAVAVRPIHRGDDDGE